MSPELLVAITVRVWLESPLSFFQCSSERDVILSYSTLNTTLHLHSKKG